MCSNFFSAGTINYKCITETFFQWTTNASLFRVIGPETAKPTQQPTATAIIDYNVAYLLHYLLQLPLLRLVSLLFLSPQSGPKKLGHKLTAIILSNVSRFTIFFTRRFLCKFAVNWLLKIPSILAYVATLYLVKTLMSENKRLTMNYEVV